jgi:dTDP-4-dehydrorhamnose reductase
MDPSSKLTILVTGSNGQLGSEFKMLSHQDPEVDFIFTSKEDLPINNKEAVRNFFKKHKPQYCINCAAYTTVDKAESEKELAFVINAEAAGILAKACKENNTKLVHISTDYVFNGDAKTPYKEDSSTDPQSVYGASKLEGEKRIMETNTGSIIIRTSWVYSSFGKNFVKTMLKLIKERQEISVVNDQIGSPTYAADLAEAIIQIIGKLSTHDSPLTIHGIYNYSNDGIISWFDFALAIKELTGSHCKINPIPTSQYSTPAKRPAYSVLDKTKIQQTFGIKLKDWKESLAICLQRIQNN